MKNNNLLAIFENYKIRRVYDEKVKIWYFSVVDIVAVLTEQKRLSNCSKILEQII